MRSRMKAVLAISLLASSFAFAVQMIEDETQPDVTVNPTPADMREQIPPLSTVKVPGPSDRMLAQFVRNKKAAIQLGKALFWEQKVGSDNKIACASCHFHAGADHRFKNQMNPGTAGNHNTFEFGVNHSLGPRDFPFRRGVNDSASSQGVFNSTFRAITDGPDACAFPLDPIFHMGRSNTRRVEPRNTPTVINAVFNFRNFWDGRANNMFAGVDPFGMRNKDAAVSKLVNGRLKDIRIALPVSSLASQASGPPTSPFEMSCAGRGFSDIGKKLLNQPILWSQSISPTDSVLGVFSRKRPTYGMMIQKAFFPNFAANNEQMEKNFSMYFGIAVQLYEATLVSDDSPFDRFAAGDDTAMSDSAKSGLSVFGGKGQCIKCHLGSEFTAASVANVTAQRITKTSFGHGQKGFHDTGFFNIGVRPTADDLGNGGKDPFGRPLSETALVRMGLSNLLGPDFDRNNEAKPRDIKRVSAEGTFKTPGLRNVELTGPYFHNGSKATLMEVVNFYSRGGDFNNPNKDPNIKNLGLSQQEKVDLVNFLVSLTDDRVRFQKAPFDHPSICVTNGHPGKNVADTGMSDGTAAIENAADSMLCIPAVGRAGARKGLMPFLNLKP